MTSFYYLIMSWSYIAMTLPHVVHDILLLPHHVLVIHWHDLNPCCPWHPLTTSTCLGHTLTWPYPMLSMISFYYLNMSWPYPMLSMASFYYLIMSWSYIDMTLPHVVHDILQLPQHVLVIHWHDFTPCCPWYPSTTSTYPSNMTIHWHDLTTTCYLMTSFYYFIMSWSYIDTTSYPTTTYHNILQGQLPFIPSWYHGNIGHWAHFYIPCPMDTVAGTNGLTKYIRPPPPSFLNGILTF